MAPQNFRIQENMGKSKRKDKQADEKLDALRNSMMDSSKEFFDKATPFEISKRLCEVGITTSYSAGIFSILGRLHDELSGEVPELDVIPQMTLGLFHKWEAEVDAKTRALDQNTIPDTAFRLSAARHFSVAWHYRKLSELNGLLVAMRQKMSEGQGDNPPLKEHA